LAIFAFDRDEKIIGVLEQGNKNACQYWNAKIKRVLNGEITLTLTVDLSHPTAQSIVEFGYLAVQNKYKQWELFLITELDQDHTETLTMNITAEASQVELDGIIIENLAFDRKNVDIVLPQLLTGTRWAVGTTVQNTDSVHDLTIKNKSVLASLQDLRDTWGIELYFHVTIAGNAISGRYVEAYVQKGAWKGKRFEWTKDLTEVKRTIDAKNIKTALIGVGTQQTITNADGTQTTTNMDFTKEVWSTTAGDPLDKPSGQNWLGDPSALAIYGKPLDGSTTKQHIMGVYSDTEATSPTDLLQHTYNQLRIASSPAVTYSMTTLDLYRILNIEQNSVDLGDTVAVIDRDLGIEILARVIEQDENLDYPEQDNSVLGNFLPNYTGLSNQSSGFQALKEQVDATGGIDPLWLKTEFGFARDALRAGNGTVIMNEGDGILIVDDPTNPQKAIKLIGGTLALANSRDLTTGEFNWRTFGTGDGILADLVDTGYLKFDRAQGGTLTVGGAVTGYKDLTQTEQVNFVGKANGDGDNTRRIFYSNSATTEGTPSTEVSAGYANVANPNDGLSMYQTITNAQTFAGFRYIRDYLNGNTVNAYNYWNEIEAWTGLTDRCAGIAPTISSGTMTNPNNITNQNHADYGYESSGNGVAKYVQIDLGTVHTDIDTIKIFHYYADGRTFHGTKTQVSADGVTWTTIFDSAVSGEYAETSAGKTYTPASVATGTLIQFYFKFVVSDLSNLISLAFQVNGTAGQPFTLKPWNMNLGHWDDTQAITFDGSADATITWTADNTHFAPFVDVNGNVWFSVLSNPLTANTTMTLSLDYVEFNPQYFVDTVPTFQDGILNIVDSEGHTVASITGDNKGFDQLYVGELTGNNAVLKNDKGDLTYYVDPINGSDDTGTGTTGAPYKTVQKVIDKLPDVNNDSLTITIVGTSITWVENIKIYGLMGGGTLNISLGVSNTLKGTIDIRNCTNNIHLATTVGTNQSTANTSTLRAQIVAQDNLNSSAVINAYCTTYLYMSDVIVNGNNVATYGINDYNSYVRQDYCECYNCTYGAGVFQFGARADITSCAGSNPHGVYAYGGAIVGGSGRGYASNPTGQEKVLANGAVCTATWTYDAGSAKPTVAPTTITTLTANDTQALFGSNWGLSDYLYTGKRPNTSEVPWYSVAFFNTRDFGFLKNADGTNRTITKVRILVQRYSGYGDNTSRKPKVWYNKQTSASGAMQALQNGTLSATGFLWGESKWITLPNSFGTAFQNGSAKSIVFYNGADEANYCRFEPKMTLEITHQ
jgi:phage minor structural protein